MNASLSAALVLALLAGTLFLGRRRSRPFLHSTDTSAVAALNRARVERLQRAPSPERDGGGTPSAGAERPQAERESPLQAPPFSRPLPIPSGPRQRQELLRQLDRWALAGPERRLQAMEVALRWRHRRLLPLLRRGLRDPHPEVAAAAARAMAQYRGRPAAPAESRPAAARVQTVAAGREAGPRRVLRTR